MFCFHTNIRIKGGKSLTFLCNFSKKVSVVLNNLENDMMKRFFLFKKNKETELAVFFYYFDLTFPRLLHHLLYGTK